MQLNLKSSLLLNSSSLVYFLVVLVTNAGVSKEKTTCHDFKIMHENAVESEGV